MIEDQRSQKVGNPKGVKKISCACFFLSMILSQVDEIHDIGVPGFNVYRECARSFVASLIDITSGGIIGAEHWNDAI